MVTKSAISRSISGPILKMILHMGGNDLLSPRGEPPTPVEDIAKDIIEAGKICRRYGVRNVFIASVTIRKQTFAQRRCEELNNILHDLCSSHGFVYMDNSNITLDHLYDGVHLKYEGSILLANNYLFYLNTVYRYARSP